MQNWIKSNEKERLFAQHVIVSTVNVHELSPRLTSAPIPIGCHLPWTRDYLMRSKRNDRAAESIQVDDFIKCLCLSVCVCVLHRADLKLKLKLNRFKPDG